METIDTFTPARSVAIAVALSAINPKNLVLAVGAAAAIAETGIPAGEQAVAYAVFVFIATLGAAVPVVAYFVLGDRATRMLDGLQAWMAAHSAAVMTVLFLVIGAKLVGDGIAGLG